MCRKGDWRRGVSLEEADEVRVTFAPRCTLRSKYEDYLGSHLGVGGDRESLYGMGMGEKG